MHHDVLDLRKRLLDHIVDIFGYLMPLAHRLASIYPDFKIDIYLVAEPAALHTVHTFDAVLILDKILEVFVIILPA